MSEHWLVSLLLLAGAAVVYLQTRTKAPPTPFEIWQAKERARR